MIDFEGFKDFYQMFKVKNVLIHQTRALQKLYMMYCRRLQKLHLHLLFSLPITIINNI